MNEAELVFTEILNCGRASLYLDKNPGWDKDKSARACAVIKRRIRGEPLQYIFGKTEFMGLEFKITPNIFIPRQETEILVEEVIKLAAALRSRAGGIEILDMATGCGCIAVSLAKFLAPVKMHAVDISEKALEVAQANASLNNVEVNFIRSDLFNSCSLKPDSYDIIVSNPPYIPGGQIESLQPEVKCEPVMALDGGQDGLDFYRRIIRAAPGYLRKNGFLAMEIGCNQIEAIKNIFRDSPGLKITEVVQDYNRMERIIVAKKQNRCDG